MTNIKGKIKGFGMEKSIQTLVSKTLNPVHLGMQMHCTRACLKN